MTWLLSPYSIKHARFLASGPTFQVEMCLVGSGHSWNYWHQWFDGGAIVLKYTTPLLIGSKWGTKVVNGSANATLNFQLSKGVASIGGSTQVKNYATHSGDTGGDPNLAVPKAWQKYDINRVNAFYISSHDLFFQGTGSSEGNVGHALYEFDTDGTVNFQVWRCDPGSGVLRRDFVPGRVLSAEGKRRDTSKRPSAVPGLAVACTSLAMLTACSSSGRSPASGCPAGAAGGRDGALGNGTLYLLLGDVAISANLWQVDLGTGRIRQLTFNRRSTECRISALRRPDWCSGNARSGVDEADDHGRW